MSSHSGDLYQFGPYCLDVHRRVLTRDNQLVPLMPKAFDLLLLLGAALSIDRGDALPRANAILLTFDESGRLTPADLSMLDQLTRAIQPS
jgi:hypothetical protein